MYVEILVIPLLKMCEGHPGARYFLSMHIVALPPPVPVGYLTGFIISPFAMKVKYTKKKFVPTRNVTVSDLEKVN